MEQSTTSSTGESDICKQIVDRYSNSVAPQHRNLCTTAIHTRSIIESKSLSPTPLSYFDTIIETLSYTSKTTRDADSVAALSLFLKIVLPRVPNKSITVSKAVNTVIEGLKISSTRALVECLGMLLEICDFDDWEFVKLGLHMLFKNSVDNCPQVRECAQDCVLKVFKSFRSTSLKIKAGNLVVESLRTYLSKAVTEVGSKSADEYEVDVVIHVLEMVDVLEALVPCLPSIVMLEAIDSLKASISANIPMLTTYSLDVMDDMLELFESSSKFGEVIYTLQDIPPKSELKMIDTIKISDTWNAHYSSIICYVAGLLTSKDSATRASKSLRRTIKRVDILKSKFANPLCTALLEELSVDGRAPNEDILAVISELFLELGSRSYIHMKSILKKLSSFMPNASGDVKHCIGSAIVAMGPEKVFELLPISVNATTLTCTNTWLIPILNDYVIRSSLGFFIGTIVHLANTFEEASQKVERDPEIRKLMKSHVRDCWGLLPAFCRHPVDLHKNFGYLAELLCYYIKKNAFMLKDIAIALQNLVKQNKNISFDCDEEASKVWKIEINEETATKNIEVLSTSSGELLSALTEVLFQVSQKKRAFIKETIGCLALITDSLTLNAVLVSSLDKIPSVDTSNKSVSTFAELASSFAGAATIERASFPHTLLTRLHSTSIDPIEYLCNFIIECLELKDDEAYATLYKILVEYDEFMSSKFGVVMDLLLELRNCSFELTTLRWRFKCLKCLLVHSIKTTRTGFNDYGYHIVHEFIVTPKDSDERKVADEILLETRHALQEASSSYKTRGPYYEFITITMWYLYKDSPQVISDAVSVLSLMISNNNSEVCNLVPDLVPAILHLLDDEDNIQVIQAVLGFIELLVLNLQGSYLQNFVPGIVRGLLPWSTVIEHDSHVKLQVEMILQTIMFKCGSASVTSHVPEKYQDFVKAKPHGQLLKYDPSTKETSLVLDGLAFANGVEISLDQEFLVVCETWKFRCLKYWLKEGKRGKVEIFIDNLPGSPDNIKLAPDGSFWVALLQLTSSRVKFVHSWKAIKHVLATFPKLFEQIKAIETSAMVMNVGSDGRIIKRLDDLNGKVVGFVSSALEFEGNLYLGSLKNDFIGKLPLESVL